MRPISCTRGPIDRCSTLHLSRDPWADSLLVTVPEEGISVDLWVTPSMAYLIAELGDAFVRDEGLPDGLRGFRNVQWLYEKIVRNPGVCPNPDRVIKDLIWQLRRRISKATKDHAAEHHIALTPVDLIESRRRTGYRIGVCGLQVVSWSPTDRD